MSSSRRPTALGPVSVPKVAPADKNRAGAVEDDEESTTVDQGPPQPPAESKDRWEEKTHREGAHPPIKTLPHKRTRDEAAPAPVAEDEDEVTVQADDSHFAGAELGTGTIDEPTVEDQANPMPPLSIVPPLPAPKVVREARPPPVRPTSVATGRLIVTAGNDNGREFELTGKPLVIGRGVDCSVVLTDIAVSRRHLEIAFDGRFYALRDLGSGNGTLINDRLEDGACQLQHGDRLELGNTIIRFEHPASKTEQAVIGWGNQADVDEEASTLAGRDTHKGPLAAKISSPDLGGDGPLPSMLQGLMLPGAPPGARITAEGPHAPLARERPAPMLEPPQLSPSSPRVNQPFPPGTSSAPLPLAANPILFSPDVYAEELHPQLLPTNRNRIVIGLILATLGVVLLAILAIIFRGGESTTAATTPTADAGASPGDPRLASADPTPNPEADPTPSDPETPVGSAPADAMATTDPSPAAPSETGASADDLLPVSTWGTNEVLLATRDRGAHERVGPSPSPERAPERAVASAPVKIQPKHDPERRTPPRRTPQKRSSPPPKPRTATSKASGSAARKKADSFYQKKQFGSAAAALRTAADGASEEEAAELRTLASKYETLDASLDKAKENQSANPTTAMAAYHRALSLDKAIGNSTHATYIRLQLGAVAPLAAASYMAQKRYEAAKKAADAAVNYGAGANTTVKRVRNALERKAGEFYQAAAKMQKKNPNGAKKLLRRVIKMVPGDSPWYAKAYKALNARSKARDEDE